MTDLKKCPYCDVFKTTKGIGTHIWRKHGLGLNHNPNINSKGRIKIAWNKGLTKDTNKIIKAQAIKQSEDLKTGKRKINKGKMSNENKLKLSRKII